MVWDILIAIASFDIATLLDIALNNLLWVFLFFAVGYIFFDGKRPVKSFFHIAFAPLFFFSLIPFLGWQEPTAGLFLGFYYLVNFSFMKFGETLSFFKDRLVWIEEFTFFGSLVVFNLII